MGAAEVLIVGAGPTGLTLAAQLLALGCRPRIIDRRAEPWRPSRALMVHPRTLELLRPLGITPALLDRGRPLREVSVHAGRRAVPVRLPGLDASDTPYPYLLMLAQAELEAVLRRHLAQRGVAVEWGVRFRGCTDTGAEVVAAVEPGPPIHTRYLVGCDGADSTVRSAAGVAYRGGDYRSAVTLADLDVTGDLPAEDLHVFVGRAGIAFLGHVGEFAPWRLLTTAAASPADAGVATGVSVQPPAWAVRIPQRYALAARYRRGRVFLAGDAAHVHSPGGGQGMNTGIGDAGNLGWKLALAVRGLAADPLLDTYEAERRPLARFLLVLTSLIYLAEASDNPVVALLRGRLASAAPLAAPVAGRLAPLIRLALRVIGQLGYGYRSGPAAREGAPRLRRGPRPGHRLRDTPMEVDGRPATLHEVTASPGLHLLVSGFTGADGALWRLRDHYPGLLSVHRAASLPDGRPGRGYYLIRPDGYVGLRAAGGDLTTVERFLAGWR